MATVAGNWSGSGTISTTPSLPIIVLVPINPEIYRYNQMNHIWAFAKENQQSAYAIVPEVIKTLSCSTQQSMKTAHKYYNIPYQLKFFI